MSLRQPARAATTQPDAARKWIALGLVGLMLMSFAGGVAMFLSAEQRAYKLEQMRARYAAKYQARLKSQTEPQAPQFAPQSAR